MIKWYDRNKDRHAIATLRDLWRNKAAVAGTMVFFVFTLAAVFAPLISPYEPNQMHPKDNLQFVSEKHLLGTDMFGRDILSRIIWGARISLLVGGLSVALSLVAGVVLGLISGFHVGLTDEFIMRCIDMMMAFPTFIFAIAILSAFGPSTTNLIMAIGIIYIPIFTRLVRGQVLTIRRLAYVEAAKSIGRSDTQIIFIEVLPNCVGPLTVQSTLTLAYAMLTEGALSFLGLGVNPPTPSWGAMVAEAYGYMLVAPWIVIFPGMTLFMAALMINIVGDGLRDVLDPRLRIA